MRSLKGKPVLLYSLEAFAQSKLIKRLLFIEHSRSKKTPETIVQSSPWKDLKIDYVRGGAELSQFTMFQLLSGRPTYMINSILMYVAIHDVARPLITSDFIKKH